MERDAERHQAKNVAAKAAAGGRNARDRKDERRRDGAAKLCLLASHPSREPFRKGGTRLKEGRAGKGWQGRGSATPLR